MAEKRKTEDAKSHVQRMRRLLRMEYECEKEEFQRQTQTMGVQRKVKRGLCWFPVSVGRSFYNSLNQLVMEVSRHSTDAEIEHSFEFGRPVCFFCESGDGSLRYYNFVATVSYADECRMVIAMPTSESIAQVLQAERLGVQLYFDETTYQAMFQALDAVEQAKGTRLAELRDMLLGEQKPKSRDIFPVGMPWLNQVQESAANKMLAARDVAIVHGPPGTGKTTTLVEAIYETLRREPQVLVCAQSNMAVDWISEKLVDRGVNVLRIGNPVRVNDKMLSFTYERRFENHPAYPELWAIRKEIRQIKARRRSSYEERESARNRLSRLSDRATELEIRINADLFNSAHVIASTLTGCNQRIMMGQHFGTLFIDEAAQALEAACWIAIRHADRVILAGDHQQLPPTIKSVEALRGGLDRTLMQEIAERWPQTVTMLQVQYRMHERIMQFSSNWFYDGKLIAAPEVKYRGILDWDAPISWIDTAEMGFKEEFVGDNFGRINKPEAELLMQTIEGYVERIGLQRIQDESIDFGIISPYRAQVQYIKTLIKASAKLRPIRSHIAVNTVDGFQGQERDVIFISLVRANEQGQIGFLSDLRRMNVAITRARMKLVILGDAATLCRHSFYHRLMEHIQE